MSHDLSGLFWFGFLRVYASNIQTTFQPRRAFHWNTTNKTGAGSMFLLTIGLKRQNQYYVCVKLLNAGRFNDH